RDLLRLVCWNRRVERWRRHLLAGYIGRKGKLIARGIKRGDVFDAAAAVLTLREGDAPVGFQLGYRAYACIGLLKCRDGEFRAWVPNLGCCNPAGVRGPATSE